jgi:homoserine trans-succinylase
MIISDTWAPLLVSAARDAVQYQENLLRSETLRNRSDHEEHLVQLSQFFEYVKDEYKKIENATGLPLEKLL